MASATQTAVDWVVGTLAADSTFSTFVGGRIYDGDAPPTSPYPFAIVFEAGNFPTAVVNGIRVLQQVVVGVKLVDQDRSYDALASTAGRADTLLEQARGTVAAGSILHCVGEDEIRQAYNEATRSYRELGRHYRVWVGVP